VVPLTVQYSASVTADDDASPLLSWSFGDGTAASVPSVARTYIAPGTYTAVAEVRAGGRSSSCSVSVTARPAPLPALPPNAPPQARFKTNPYPTSGSAPLTVDFNACQSSDPDGDRLLFRFDVFDGMYDSRHCRREHTYRSAGTFEAKMCVTDEFPGHEDVCQSYTVTVK
jgi:PKD repeat protein